MGPRRKLTQAFAELKGKETVEEKSSRRNGRPDRKSEEEEGKASTSSSATPRPQLLRQSSTDVTGAYREVRRWCRCQQQCFMLCCTLNVLLLLDMCI